MYLFDFVYLCTVYTSKISGRQCTSMGPVHCSRDPQILFFSNFFIKNGSHGTIHTFKNYFDEIFSTKKVVSKRILNLYFYLWIFINSNG